jgi:hypothetical protein
VNAVVVLARDVAARQLRLRDQFVVAVASGAGRFEVRVIRSRDRILRSTNVVLAVAVGARGGDCVAALACLAVSGLQIFPDLLRMAGGAVDRLQLVRMRNLVRRNIRVAGCAVEAELSVDRFGERGLIDRNRFSARVLRGRIGVTSETHRLLG